MWTRSLLFLSDSKDAPKSNWIKQAGMNKTKLFTAIQVFLLGSMWYIKGTKVGVLFPVLIGCLAPVRIMLEKMGVFSEKELEALDGEI